MKSNINILKFKINIYVNLFNTANDTQQAFILSHKYSSPVVGMVALEIRRISGGVFFEIFIVRGLGGVGKGSEK
jgi:hypothetical protein